MPSLSICYLPCITRSLEWGKEKVLPTWQHYLTEVYHRVVRPGPSKMESVQSFPILVSKKDVRAFIGLTGYYHKFILVYATIALPFDRFN